MRNNPDNHSLKETNFLISLYEKVNTILLTGGIYAWCNGGGCLKDISQLLAPLALHGSGTVWNAWRVGGDICPTWDKVGLFATDTWGTIGDLWLNALLPSQVFPGKIFQPNNHYIRPIIYFVKSLSLTWVWTSQRAVFFFWIVGVHFGRILQSVNVRCRLRIG